MKLEDRPWWPELLTLKDVLSLRELALRYEAAPAAIANALKRNGVQRQPAPSGPRANRDPGWQRAAEIAVTVADEWQGRGLGSLLGKHLAHAARNRNIRRFTATMQSDNVPAHRLMGRLTDQLEQHHVGGGVDELVLDLAA